MTHLLRRWSKAWLVAIICLTTIGSLLIAPELRSSAQSGSTYTITDLGPAGGISKGYGLNNSGQVVGQFATTHSEPCDALPCHSFLWSGTSLINLEAASTTASGSAYAVNNSARAAGNFVLGNGQQQAFTWHDDDNDGVSDAGELQALPFPPGDVVSAAWDINDSNQVVGQSEDDNFAGHAVRWQGGNAEILSTLNGIQPIVAYGINNSGHIVGAASNNQGFFFDGMTNVGIATFGGPKSVAYAVSDTDFAVGYAEFSSMSGSFPRHAFIWNIASGLKDLGTLSGDTSSIAQDIATVGGFIQVVGGSIAPANTSRAFIWQDGNGNGAGDPGEMKELLTLVQNPTGWSNLQEARSINGLGQIVGFGTRTNGETHAFLLSPPGVNPTPTPTPTPATTSLISVQGTGAYGGTGTLSATLYSNDMPVFGKAISFTLNSSAVCGGSTGVTCPTTNASGVAILSGVGLSGINAGNYPSAVGASFAGDSSYGSASQNGLLTVTPVLLLETGTINAAAVDSVTFVRGPFSVTDNHNFSGDHLTRIIIFTSPLANPEPTLKVFASGHELQVENFGTLTGVPGLDASYIVVKLDPILTGSGPINYDLTISLRGVTSNTATLTIVP